VITSTAAPEVCSANASAAHAAHLHVHVALRCRRAVMPLKWPDRATLRGGGERAGDGTELWAHLSLAVCPYGSQRPVFAVCAVRVSSRIEREKPSGPTLTLPVIGR